MWNTNKTPRQGVRVPTLQMGIQPERERKNDTGESVFPETYPISLFSGLLIYFLLYIGMNIESCGVSRPDPCHNQVLHIKLYKGLRGFTSSSGHEAC